VVFLGTYEFGFVSGMAMVTEADRMARGTVVGTTHSVGTLLRAGGALCGGWLYERSGMPAVTVAAGIATALAALALHRSARPADPPVPGR
jgi:predicted MFS family arabinose efflux permease